ncbi:MAG: ribose 5-phosphate isomerase B [Elusimicrobia bacterium]|nr:ribose 5-phosphate isomerase B [Elusimicrobiota bacterium]
MKIIFGCDHAGYAHKALILDFLKKEKYSVLDFGCDCAESCDYTPIAKKVADAVSKGDAERGILICGTGVGMSIAANKFKGVRAACCWADEIASLISKHNMANIICLPGRFADTKDLIKWIKIWIDTPHSTEKRHINRIQQISEIEKNCCK